MALVLSILISLLSVGILAGRIYENIYLTDIETGLLLTKGVASNPLLLFIFVAITVCCAVLIFGDNKAEKAFFADSSRICAGIAGAGIIINSVITISSGKIAFLMLCGGLAWVLVAVFGMGKRKEADMVIMVLMVLYAAGLCLSVIVADVSTIYNTMFFKKVVTNISIMLLMLVMGKNAYSPSKYSKMLLYIGGFLCFAFAGVFNIADLIADFAIKGNFSLLEIELGVSMAFLGVLGLDNALSVLPAGNKKEDECIEELVEYPQDGFEDAASVSNGITEFENTSREKEQNDKEIKFNTVFFEKNGKSKPELKEKTIFKGVKAKAEKPPKNEKVVYKRPK